MRGRLRCAVLAEFWCSSTGRKLWLGEEIEAAAR
jgi:hypothetical protein